MEPVREGNIYLSPIGNLIYVHKSAGARIYSCYDIRREGKLLMFISTLQTYTLVGTPYEPGS